MVGAVRKAKVRDDRRSSGIAGLDFQLDGGFPKGRTIAVCGNPLSGCELIAGQFLKAGGGGSYVMIDGIPGEGMTDARHMDFYEILAALKGDLIVIDSLSSIIDRFGIGKAVFLLNEGTKDLRAAGADIMVIVYDDFHSPAEMSYVCRNADIFIQLNEVIHGNEIERTLSVRKMAGLGIPGRVYPYNITAGGIELSTTERVV
ncbi:MAG: hypothetical protein IKT21_02190 [Methanomicrobium sp.]|nr:hypothetical protein [Methanomicrobium sp.]